MAAVAVFNSNKALIGAVRRNFKYWEKNDISKDDLKNVRLLVRLGFEGPGSCNQALSLAIRAYPVVERFGDLHAWTKILERASIKIRLDQKEASRLMNLLGLLNWGVGEFEAAKRYHEGANTLARGSKQLMAESQYGLAQSLSAMGDLFEAELYCEHALRYFESHAGFIRSMAATQNLLGMIHFAQGNFKLAVGDFYHSYSNFSKAKDHLGMARSMNNRAMNKAKLGEYRQAIAFYDMAAKYFALIGDDLGVCQVTASLGILFFQLGYLDEAKKTFQLAIPLDWDMPGVKKHRGWMALVQGYLYLSQGESQSAIVLFEESLSFWQAEGNERMQSYAETGMEKANNTKHLT